jgi:hypothetical protein
MLTVRALLQSTFPTRERDASDNTRQLTPLEPNQAASTTHGCLAEARLLSQGRLYFPMRTTMNGSLRVLVDQHGVLASAHEIAQLVSIQGLGATLKSARSSASSPVGPRIRPQRGKAAAPAPAENWGPPGSKTTL